jgi:hypothetical protein
MGDTVARAPLECGKDSVLRLVDQRFLLIHGIMARSFSPTFSIGCLES